MKVFNCKFVIAGGITREYKIREGDLDGTDFEDLFSALQGIYGISEDGCLLSEIYNFHVDVEDVEDVEPEIEETYQALKAYLLPSAHKETILSTLDALFQKGKESI